MLSQYVRSTTQGPSLEAMGDVRPQARMGIGRSGELVIAHRFDGPATPSKQAFAATQDREAPW